jgi:release factor glutamine methyltransferase
VALGPATTDDAPSRAQVVASIAVQLESAKEARWIVEEVGTEEAQSLADRRAAGEPLQYVLGRWPFRSLELVVDPRVLIPRPETEQVVEVALDELARLAQSEHRRTDGSWVCVDLGTGSGAIALSMATEGAASTPGLEVWATDASSDALEVARANLDALTADFPDLADRVHVAEGSWFDALPDDLAGRVDLLVSNPPYVAESELPELDATVRDWEPAVALVASRGSGGVGGMAAIETIVAGAPRWLKRGGALVVEIAPAQAYSAIDAARRAGFSRVAAERDLAGRLRILVARR